MNNIGLANFFLNPDPERSFQLLSKKNLCEHVQYMWYRSLKSNKKLKFYNTFKKVFEFENYLDCVSFYKDRKLLTKFRCSNHNLQIERGRQSNTPNKERICKLCNKQVETEKHFLTYCPKFNKFRESGFSESWFNCIKSKNKNQIYTIVNYLRKAEKVRKNNLRSGPLN